MNEIVEILSALLTPTIAVIAVYIAYHQFKVNKHRARIDLYEKRYNLYEQVLRLIQRMIDKDASPDEIIFEFRKDTSGAYFLFGDEIGGYLTTLCDNAIEVQLIEEQLSKLKLTKEQIADKKNQKKNLKRWFFTQFKESRKYFYKYLKFDEI